MRKINYQPCIGDIINCDLSNGKISIFRNEKSVTIFIYEGEISKQNIASIIINLVSPFEINKVKELEYSVQYKIIPTLNSNRRPAMAFLFII